MLASFRDWTKLIDQCYEYLDFLFSQVFLYLNTLTNILQNRNTKPGGWVEFQDFDLQYYSDDNSLKSDSKVVEWIGLILEASRKAGREPCPGPWLEGWVRKAGFVGVAHESMKVPIGTWPKKRELVGGGTPLESGMR